MNSKIIRIDSFNPYESRFPNRKLVSRETLVLIKYLRLEGYEIIITPEDDKPLELLYKKGFTEIFSDPINIALLGIPIGILTTIISNQIQKAIDKFGESAKLDNRNINITIDNSTKQYNYLGEFQTSNNHKLIETQRKKLKDGFSKSFKLKSPYPNYPTPIFLEHKPKIVGWCSLFTDDKGLKADGIVTDKLIRKRIQQNRLNGMSVTGIAKETKCSICENSYVNCNHIAGNYYDEKECYNTVVKTDFVEASIVKEPINRECLVNLV